MPGKKYQYIRHTEVYEGKQYEGSGKTHAEAYRKLAAKIEAAKRGEAASSSISVGDWAERWLRDYVRPKVRKPGQKKVRGTMAEKNYRMYEQQLRLSILPAIGSRRLKDVSEPELRAILNDTEGASFSHVSKRRIVLKAMFRQAFAARLIPYDPAALLEMPAAPKGKRRSITPEEKTVFYAVAASHPHGLFFRFLIATGLRPNELCALRVEDVDMERGLVRITKAIESGANVQADTKTSVDRYTVINPTEDPSVQKDLAAYLRRRKKEAYLFTQKDGKSRVTEQCFKRYWQSLTYAMDIAMGAETTPHGHIYDPKDLRADGAPIYPDPKDPSKPRNGHKLAPDLVAYCLRHTFGTNMQRQGVPIEVTKYLMGHADITTTANIYIDSGEPEALRAMEQLTANMGKHMGKSKQTSKNRDISTNITP